MNRSTLMSGVALLLTAGLALAQGRVNAEDQAAPRVGSLNLPGTHGLGFVANDGSNAAIALQVIATSRSSEAVTPASLPDDWAARLPDVPPGRYVREEWDKGASLRDNWSARWIGTLHVEKEGEYTFYLTTDDGTRLRLDDQLAIDFWQPRPPGTSEAQVKLSAGDHPLVVEFFEAGGGAVARLEWSGEGLERQVLPPERVTSGGQPGWKAEYFNNVNLEGEPAKTEQVEKIDTDWGEGGPRIGEEEPGPVTLEWTCDEPGHMVGRVHAGADNHIGLLSRAGGNADLQFSPRWAAATVGDWTLAICPVGKPVVSPEFLPGTATDKAWSLAIYPWEREEVMLSVPPRNGELWYAPADGAVLFEAYFRFQARGPGDFPVAIRPIVARQALRDAFQAGRQPNLPPYPPDAEGWIPLFNGKDTTGWKMRNPGAPNHWQAVGGLLQNVQGGGSDIYTEGTFTDFDLHVEFRVPPGSNSGVYLQGIYEIQVDDCFGQDLRDTMCGAVYHKITPSVNAAKPAGEWQTFDVNFRAATIDDTGQITPARVTLVFNGVKTIDNKEIDGITGSAMSDRVLDPGPLMFQGDHGPVDYRNVKIRPR